MTEELIPDLNRLKQNVNAGMVDGDEAEAKRRSELFRYARRLLAMPAFVNSLCSTLDEIEKRSRALLEKHGSG